MHNTIKETVSSGSLVDQSVESPTIGLNSDLDLRVVNLSPALGSTMGVEPT